MLTGRRLPQGYQATGKFVQGRFRRLTTANEASPRFIDPPHSQSSTANLCILDAIGKPSSFFAPGQDAQEKPTGGKSASCCRSPQLAAHPPLVGFFLTHRCLDCEYWRRTKRCISPPYSHNGTNIEVSPPRSWIDEFTPCAFFCRKATQGHHDSFTGHQTRAGYLTP